MTHYKVGNPWLEAYLEMTEIVDLSDRVIKMPVSVYLRRERKT